MALRTSICALLSAAVLLAYQPHSPVAETNFMTIGLEAAYGEYRGFFVSGTTYVPYTYLGQSDSSFMHVHISGIPSVRIAPFRHLEAKLELPIKYTFERYEHTAVSYSSNIIFIELESVRLSMKYTLIDWYLSAALSLACDIPVHSTAMFDGNRTVNDALNVTGGVLGGVIPRVIPINLYVGLYGRTKPGLSDKYLATAVLEWVTSPIAAISLGVRNDNNWTFNSSVGSFVELFVDVGINFSDRIHCHTGFSKKLEGIVTADDRVFSLRFYYDIF
ncbi:MAG: hypothetical protein AABZ39_07615 [Spirochaetota bacterium]